MSPSIPRPSLNRTNSLPVRAQPSGSSGPFVDDKHPPSNVNYYPPAQASDILTNKAAFSAIHDTKSRRPPETPGLEGMREQIIEELSHWIETAQPERLCWVHGGAGVGKSAVAHTICNKYLNSHLAASFYFDRNDPSCNVLAPFLPTIAHQLSTNPAYKKAGFTSALGDIIWSRPGIFRFDTNWSAQFDSLILEPFTRIASKKWNGLPTLIVIDGLDECMGLHPPSPERPTEAQETLLTLFHNYSMANPDPSTPLRFLIFSRPEHTIQDFFRSVGSKSLDMHKFQANHMRLFLEKEFAALPDLHPEAMIEAGWPGEDIILNLVEKSDRYFRYVVTAMKYISQRDDPELKLPQQRLDLILQTDETVYHDLSNLDRLFHLILRQIQSRTFQNHSRTFRFRERVLLPILRLLVTPYHKPNISRDYFRYTDFQMLWRSQDAIAGILGLDSPQVATILNQLHLFFQATDSEDSDVLSLHASFLDFLDEERRSRGFHVQPMDQPSYLNLVCTRLLPIVTNLSYRYSDGDNHVQLVNWTNEIELCSINVWPYVEELALVDESFTHSASQDYTSSHELLSALNGFDIFHYVNMLLDWKYMEPVYTVPLLKEMWTPEDNESMPPVQTSAWLLPLNVNTLYLIYRRHSRVDSPLRNRLRPFLASLKLFFEGSWVAVFPKSSNRSQYLLGLIQLISPEQEEDLTHERHFLSRMWQNQQTFLKVFPEGTNLPDRRDLETQCITQQQRQVFAKAFDKISQHTPRPNNVDVEELITTTLLHESPKIPPPIPHRLNRDHGNNSLPCLQHPKPPSMEPNRWRDQNNNYGSGPFNITYKTAGESTVVDDSLALKANSNTAEESGLQKLATKAAFSALHDSKSRGPRTRCLEGTRVEVIQELSDWIESVDSEQLCWVYGAAGVGKSAIAQTICEKYVGRCFGASFYFSRNDSSRDTLAPFIPTISHQLAINPVLDNAGFTSAVDDIVLSKPGLFHTSWENQFKWLILEPLARIESKKRNGLTTLIVIDALDECMGLERASTSDAIEAQEMLLSIIRNATSASPPLPLRFLIFSRPESTILEFFRSAEGPAHKSLDMRNFRTQADHDIRLYLEKEFAALACSHRQARIEAGWPGEVIILDLIRKSDGHFIYVVTAMKYISLRADPELKLPQERLDIVLRTQESAYPDLSDLDQLFHHILSRFINARERLLLPILRLLVTPHYRYMNHIEYWFPTDFQVPWRSPHAISRIVGLDSRRVAMILSHLHSVFQVPDSEDDSNVLFLHASFSDFLTEKWRSRDFYVQPLDQDTYFDRLSRLLLIPILTYMIPAEDNPVRLFGPTTDTDLVNVWTFVMEVLFAKSSSQDHNPSDELLGAMNRFDMFQYVNMLLNRRYVDPMNAVNVDENQRVELKPTPKSTWFLPVNINLLSAIYHHHHTLDNSLQDKLSPFLAKLKSFFEGSWVAVFPLDSDRNKCLLDLTLLMLPPHVYEENYQYPSFVESKNRPKCLKIFPRAGNSLEQRDLATQFITHSQRDTFVAAFAASNPGGSPPDESAIDELITSVFFHESPGPDDRGGELPEQVILVEPNPETTPLDELSTGSAPQPHEDKADLDVVSAHSDHKEDLVNNPQSILPFLPKTENPNPPDTQESYTYPNDSNMAEGAPQGEWIEMSLWQSEHTEDSKLELGSIKSSLPATMNPNPSDDHDQEPADGTSNNPDTESTTLPHEYGEDVAPHPETTGGLGNESQSVQSATTEIPNAAGNQRPADGHSRNPDTESPAPPHEDGEDVIPHPETPGGLGNESQSVKPATMENPNPIDNQRPADGPSSDPDTAGTPQAVGEEMPSQTETKKKCECNCCIIM